MLVVHNPLWQLIVHFFNRKYEKVVFQESIRNSSLFGNYFCSEKLVFSDKRRDFFLTVGLGDWAR